MSQISQLTPTKFAPYFKKRTFAEFDNDIKSTTKISKGNSNTNTNRTEREERQTRLKALNQRALNRRLLKANPNPCAAPKARLTTLNRSRVTEREQKNQAVQRLDVATWESEDMIEARIEHFEVSSSFSLNRKHKPEHRAYQNILGNLQAQEFQKANRRIKRTISLHIYWSWWCWSHWGVFDT